MLVYYFKNYRKLPILIIGFLLILFGILSVYSVSIYESFDITLKLYNEASNYYYFSEQIKNLIFWLIVSWIVYLIPLDFIKKYRNYIFIWSVFIILLLFTPLGITLNWAKWWLYIKWLWTLQPAEFFKLWFVIFFSWWLIKKKKEKLFEKSNWILFIVIMTLLFFIQFVFIRDWWTLLIMFPIVLIMFWYSTWDRRKVIWMVWLYMLFWLVWLTLLWDFAYVKSRIAYYVNPDVDADGRWIWWQTEQSLISIGWWWFFGKWYWNWLQKFWNLPEAQSDFIFAAFSEEIWFFGNIFLLFLYFWLAYYFLQRLMYEKDEYYRNLWVWIISLIMVQVFVHIGVNTKLLPLTWLTLPFISVGWTALMINLIELTLLYKIYKNAWKNITEENPFKLKFKVKHRKVF